MRCSAKGKADGMANARISNHGFIDSIYFRDPLCRPSRGPTSTISMRRVICPESLS